MSSEYDKARWFELIKTGSFEEVSNELQNYPKKFLLSLTDNSQSRHTCLYYSAQHQNIDIGNQITELLLREGADANYKDALQQSVLFYASRHGHDVQVEMLINAGADPNARDAYGQSPLYYASREGHTSTVTTLIARGADVNLVDNLGQTPIFYSCREGKFEATQALVENGANINHQDKSRNTPLTWAKKSNIKIMIDYLISKGALDKGGKKKEPDETKKKEEKRKGGKKLKCQLMIVDEKGEERPISQEELMKFEEDHPDIAKYWKNPETLEELDRMDQDSIDKIKPWEKPGKKLIANLWRANHAWIFHEPVDPVKLNILDYFDIVKRPMDFGTIKKKLNNNVYKSGEEFIKDLDLVFENCRLYNKPDSDVIKMCNQVQSVYLTQRTQLGLDSYKP
ncbi:unnamed protein product [Blepharisma stoltei]|uniref:Bromo domain-containing protein n=1 Tax=Blepharisma stoltei TaxID=1481888 RepID=A0AAU9IBU1_9CILI|nr:unnamed protein product [Blepharisma stoltei]